MGGDVSPAALAANRRLYELRARLAAERAEQGDAPTGQSTVPSHSLSSIPANTHRAHSGHGRHQGQPPTTATGDSAASPPARPATPAAAQASKGEREQGGILNRQSPHRPTRHPVNPESDSHSHSAATLLDRIASLPPHLGWGSETLTAHLRKSRMANDESRIDGPFDDPWNNAAEPHHSPPATPNSSLVTRHSSLKIYPAIALGMLREERTAAGRVWLLLRALDAPGRGMVAVDEAHAALCDKASPLRLCGWRRLRQLLAEGEGVFWARERGRVAEPRRPDRFSETCQVSAYEDRLRLFGPARVAAALGVRRLAGRPVGVPVAALLGPIGDARAHLYAAFHSGRAKEVTSYELRVTSSEAHSSLVTRHSSLGSPIARDTLAGLSGVCARSQAAYERRAGVASRANIALGERVAAGAPDPAEQERAWRQGRAVFRLRDHRGRHGRPGATYLAWRLPNAYGPATGHQPRPKGRQKRINRQLADLFTKGMTGNGARVEKRFYAGAIAACKAAERAQAQGEGGSRAEERSMRLGQRPATGRQAGERSMRPGQRPATGRHWPLPGPARGVCRLWATMEPATGPLAPNSCIAQGSQPSFFSDRGGKELRGL